MIFANPVFSLLSFIGSNSMIYFVSHAPIIVTVNFIGNKFHWSPTCCYVVMVILILFVSIILSLKVVRNSRLFNYCINKD